MPLTKIKLDSLLDITKAISKNTPEDDLYKIFYYTLIANPQLEKVAMLVHEGDEWLCKFSNADSLLVESAFYESELSIDTEEGDQSADSLFAPIGGITQFDIALPVVHKEKKLAFVLLSKDKFDSYDEDVHYPIVSFVQTIANIIMTAIENKRMGRQRLAQEALKKEMEIAKEVQQMLLPKSLTKSDKYELNVDYIPHQSVGGDYYDYIQLGENEFLLCIADVSGKGVPASIIMSNFQAGLRLLSKTDRKLDEILADLNEMIYQNASGEKFITSFIAKCNTELKKIEYINAGHNPVHLIKTDGDSLELTEGSTILGVVDPLPYITVNEVNYSDGDVLFMYTDGLLEAKNEQEEYFGTEKVAQILVENKELDITAIGDKVLQEVNDFVGGNRYDDDLTMLSCKFL